MPAGAVGIWYADQYTTSPRIGIPNAVVGGAISPNILSAPKRLFNTAYYTGSLTTVTDADISQVVGAVGDWFLTLNVTLPAGTYTYSVDLQWVSGATDVRIGSNAALSTKTITGAMTTYSSTFSTAGGVVNFFAVRSGSSLATTFNITNARLHLGSSDLGVDTLAGHVYFGQTGAGNQPTVSGNTITVSGDSTSRGLAQFPTSHVLTAFTAIAVGKRNVGASGGQFQSFLEKVQTVNAFAPTFAGTLNDPLFAYNGGSIFSSSQVPSNTDLWQYRNGDFHVIANRYSTPTASMFMDGSVGVQETVSAGLTATVQDLFWSKKEYDTYAVALWERALTDAEVMQATRALTARAAGVAISVATNRLLIPEGDSITFGQGAPSGSYASLFAVNSSPVVNGPIFARPSATLSGNAGNSLTGRAALVDLAVSGKGARQAVLTVLIGRNDIVGYAGGVAQYITDLLAYCAARKAAGMNKIVICTIMPSTFAGLNAARATFNSTIIAGGWAAANGISAVVNFDSDTTNFSDAAASDVSKYADGTHPTDVVQAAAEVIYRAVVNAL